MNKRLEWIDIARGISIIMIIVGHSLYLYTFSFFAKVIFAVHVPIFFVLSGYLYKQKRVDNIIKNGLATLILPYVFTASIVIVLTFVSNQINFHGWINPIGSTSQAIVADMYGIGTPGTLKLGSKSFLITSIGVIWFLLSLFLSKILYQLNFKFLNNIGQLRFIKLFLLVIVECILGFLLTKIIIMPWSVGAALASQPFLFFGQAVKKFNILNFKPYLVSIICLLLWGLSAFSGFFWLNIPAADNPFFAVLGGMGGSLLIIKLSILIDNKKIFCNFFLCLGKGH